MNRNDRSPSVLVGAGLGALLVALLVLPLFALVLTTSIADLWFGLRHPLFAPAMVLSVRTTFISLAVIVVTGVPVAWWLATTRSRFARLVGLVVDLPVMMPPAVVGIALLQTFGRQGLLGPPLQRFGVAIPFTEAAVIIAQVVVAAPLFVQTAEQAFRAVDRDLMTVARTLGASTTSAFVRVAVPVARPAMIAGASLAWARALGELGATLLFAGNMTGTTQTMPLAIFTALESDVRIAVVFSLVLVAIGATVLITLRLALADRRPDAVEAS